MTAKASARPRENFLLGKKLLVVTAHPDDESYMASGTILKNRQQGGSSVLVCATLGEKGLSHLKRKVSPAKLKSLRRGELKKVSAWLGVKKLYILGLPDGKVERHAPEFYRRALAAAKQYKPDLVLGYASDGISGHVDHVAAGQVARRVAKTIKVPFVSWALPPRSLSVMKKTIKLRRKNPHYIDVKDMKHLRANLTVPIGNGVKLRSLRFHKSQLDANDPFKHYPKNLLKDFLSAEYFVV